MSDERALLTQTVRDLVGKHAGPEAVRAAMESERGYDESLWTLLCEQVGVAALVVPEELGGAGGELADAAAVIERTRPGPGAHPAAGHDPGRTRAAGRRRTGHRHAWSNWPRASPSAPSCSIPSTWSTVTSPTSSIAAEDGALTRWTEFTASPAVTMDPTRRLARVTAGQTAPLGRDPGLADTAALLLAAEQVGAATRCLDLTVDYTKDRVQFGRPIGSFQALKHRMADLYVKVQTAGAVVDEARRGPVPDLGRAGPRHRHRGVPRRRGRGGPDARRDRHHLPNTTSSCTSNAPTAAPSCSGSRSSTCADSRTKHCAAN